MSLIRTIFLLEHREKKGWKCVGCLAATKRNVAEAYEMAVRAARKQSAKRDEIKLKW